MSLSVCDVFYTAIKKLVVTKFPYFPSLLRQKFLSDPTIISVGSDNFFRRIRQKLMTDATMVWSGVRSRVKCDCHLKKVDKCVA